MISPRFDLNSAAGSFGLAFASATVPATLSFPNMAESSTELAPAEQRRVADALQHAAEVTINTQLRPQLAGEPQQTQEVIRISTDARHRALQVALLIPILAGPIGPFTSFRTMCIPAPRPSAAVGGMSLG